MKAKYDLIGKDYNATRSADPYIFDRLRHHLQPREQGRYLDIGCGTGNYTKKFDTQGFHFTGVDPSQEMLKKAANQKNTVDWKLGRAEALDFPSHSFDGALATLTLHHWEHLEQGFKSLNTVLKPSGRLVIFTASPKQMTGYWLHHYFPKMLADSMRQMPKLEVIETHLQENGFTIEGREKYFVRPDLHDKFLYAGKHDPKLYLHPNIRNGISSFSALSHKDEVKRGLALLAKDIESGMVAKVITSYQNNDGDYLFLIAQKR